MQFRFVGCGDAFGSGGRFNTCFHVVGAEANFLIDCGATSLVALKQSAVALNDIQTILITHAHADHFGGLPAFMLDAMFVSRRKQPLTIIGPPGIRDTYMAATEVAYRGSSRNSPRFELRFLDAEPGRRLEANNLEVTSFAVRHGAPEGQYLAYRIEAEGRIIAYTGDTEWTEGLIEAGRNADLYVVEAYTREKKIPLHLDLATFEQHLPEISARRIVLTHMSPDMLEKQSSVPFECAYDGLNLEL